MLNRSKVTKIGSHENKLKLCCFPFVYICLVRWSCADKFLVEDHFEATWVTSGSNKDNLGGAIWDQFCFG